jgi:hypothetical protein
MVTLSPKSQVLHSVEDLTTQDMGELPKGQRGASPAVDQLVSDLGLSTYESQQLIETLWSHWEGRGVKPTNFERFINSERLFQEIVIEAVRTPDARVKEVTTEIIVEAAKEAISPQDKTELLNNINAIRDRIISLIGPERIAELHSSATKPETVGTTIAQSITPYGTLIQGGRAVWNKIAKEERNSTVGQDTSNLYAQQRGEFSENLAHFLIECGFDDMEVLTSETNSVADARGYDFGVVVQTANGKEIYAFDAKSSIRGLNDKISLHLRLGIQNTSKDHRKEFERYLEIVTGGAKEAADLKEDLLGGNCYIEWVAPGTRGKDLQTYLHDLPERFQMVRSDINKQISDYLRNALLGDEIEQKEAAKSFIAKAAAKLGRTDADLEQNVLNEDSNDDSVEWISPQSSSQEISDYLKNLPGDAHIT